MWFTGWVLPYLCERPVKNPSIWKESITGLFLALYAGRIWNGWQIGCRHWGVGNDGRIRNLLKKTHCERGDISPENGNFIFPVADGRIKLPGGDQDLRTSTLMRHRLIRGESHVDFLGESEGSLPPPHDSFPHAGETINDFRSMSGNFLFRHYVEQESNFTRREKNHSFLHPELRIRIWRQARETHPRLLEYRWVTTGLTQPTLLKKNLQTDMCGPGRDWRENSWHPSQIIYGQKLWRKWEEMPSWRRGKNGHMKSQNSIMPEKLRGICFIDPEDTQFKEIIQKARRKLETPMAPAVPCKTCKKSMKGETRDKTDDFNSKFACILEASESTRMRKEESLPNFHEDHIAGKGNNSLQHDNLAHKFIPVSNNEDTRSKSSSGQRMGKTWKDSGVGQTKSQKHLTWLMKQEKKVEKYTSHHWWTSLIWRMPNWIQSTKKIKGWVVLRGDIVKDDSGSCAAFTEQGSSASQWPQQRSWMSSPDFQVRRTSSWCSICVYPG